MRIEKLSDYTKTFAINHLMGVEGGAKLTNYADDRGGKTKFGIIEKTFLEDEFKNLRDTFKIHRVEDITYDFAFAFYEQGWWKRLCLDDICSIHPMLADRILDIAVNGGRGLAGKFLQQILNVYNLKQKFYNDLVVDGAIGPNTVGALRRLIEARGNDGVLNVIIALFGEQSHHYIALSLKSESQETFTFGWTNRVRNALDMYYRLILNS